MYKLHHLWSISMVKLSMRSKRSSTQRSTINTRIANSCTLSIGLCRYEGTDEETSSLLADKLRHISELVHDFHLQYPDKCYILPLFFSFLGLIISFPVITHLSHVISPLTTLVFIITSFCYAWSWVRGKHSLWVKGSRYEEGLRLIGSRGSYARDFLGKG